MFGKDFLLLIDRPVAYAAVAGGTAIDCTLGTIEVSANNAAVIANTSITCTLATVELATYAATVATDITIDATTATIELSANAATVRNDWGELTESYLAVAPTMGGWLTMPRQIYINTDNDVVLAGLRYEYSDVYIAGATLTCALKDAVGNTVVTGVAMSYQAGSNGDYKGVLLKASLANLIPDADYWVEVTGVNGADNLFQRVRRQAGYHGVQ